MSDIHTVPITPVGIPELEQALALLLDRALPKTFNQNLSALEDASPALRSLLKDLIDSVSRMGGVGRSTILGQPGASQGGLGKQGLTFLSGFSDQGFLERQVFGG